MTDALSVLGAAHAATGRVGNGIGQPVLRKEDARLVTGRGCFSDDVNLPGQAHAAVVRSPHAHARILGVDTAEAVKVPGVLAVLTGADVLADGLNPIPHKPVLQGTADIVLHNRDGSDKFISKHLPLPNDKVRFIGEAVAIVIAETKNAAKDGAEAVEVQYEVLPSVTNTADAAKPDAPVVWEQAGSNVCVDAEVGDAKTTEAAFARATHVARLETWVQRLTGVPLEPRSAVGAYDPVTKRYTLYAGSGNVTRQKRELSTILGVPEEQVRVVAKDIGGNFGTRNAFYPEFALVAWASRRLGRPVKWTCERHESFLSDYQGRDLFVEAELALDAEGNFLALRGSNLSNVGAHTVSFVPLTKGVSIMTSVYRIPAACFRARAVTSNTPPTNSYRSAGRPEAMFIMERLIDIAARQYGFDPVELRRKNFIPEHALPYLNPLGITYDKGAYEQVMNTALSKADWNGFAGRKAESAKRGKCRGIAVANYIEITTGMPRERTEIIVHPEGCVDVVIGTLSSGQGHETSFAQLVTEWLGVPFEKINLITGDTDLVPVGGGSQSGRSMRLAGIVIGTASQDIAAKAKRIAARVLNSDESEISFRDGRFSSPGSARSLDIFEIAAAATTRNDLPEDLFGPLSAVSDQTVRVGGYPYGSHVCEVEVDPDDGEIQIVGYTAVDDVGRAVNPLILHGQAHGGIAQGIGQALMEQCYYDADGQLLTGSFMDYAMPRAPKLPFFVTEISEVPSPNNALGVRAGGEGGTTPALAVVVSAVVDALAEFGVQHLGMPVTSERVWRAVNEARNKTAS